MVGYYTLGVGPLRAQVPCFDTQRKREMIRREQQDRT